MIYLDVQGHLYNSFVEVDVLVMCFNFWVFCSFGAFFTVSISALGLPWNKITTRDYFSSEMRGREKPYIFTFSGILFRYIQGIFQNLFMYTEILVLNSSTNSTSLIKESPLWKATFSDFHTTFFSLGRPAFRTVVVWCFPFFCLVEIISWVRPCKFRQHFWRGPFKLKYYEPFEVFHLSCNCLLNGLFFLCLEKLTQWIE